MFHYIQKRQEQMNANTIPSVFNFGANEVRTFMMESNPWFAAFDICSILGIKNHRESVRHLDDDEKGVISNDTLGGKQQITIVNESGLYSLVLRSRKPEARKFTKWITSEVLPAIRKTGSYLSKKVSERDVHFNPEDKGSLCAVISDLVPIDLLPAVMEVISARLPVGGADLSRPDYYQECRDELFKFADSLPKGTKWPSDEAIQQRIADGYMSSILMSRRWLMSFDHNGRMQTTSVAKNAAIVDAGDPVNMHTLISEYVPLELLPKVIESANNRLAWNLNRLMGVKPI